MGLTTGGGLTLGGYAIFGGKEEVKDPDPHGDVKYGERADSLINAAQGIIGLSEQTETAPIQGEGID